MKPVAAALLASLALAAPMLAPSRADAQATAPAVAQKQNFVLKLVEDSPVARRIRGGNNAEARQLLDTAVAQYRQAVAAQQAGDLAVADKLLNDAIWSLGRARQLSPDNADELIHRRAEYSRLIGGLDALRASYQRHLKRSGGSDAQLLQLDAQMERARTMAAAESFAPAVRQLQEAERGLVQAMSQLLGAAPLVYAQKYDTPADEYAAEIDRNRGYEELVPIAIRERRPGPEAIAKIEHHLDVNRALRDHARGHAERGEWPDALVAVRNGTVQLQGALAAAGLVVPTAMAAETAAESRQ